MHAEEQKRAGLGSAAAQRRPCSSHANSLRAAPCPCPPLSRLSGSVSCVLVFIQKIISSKNSLSPPALYDTLYLIPRWRMHAYR